MQYPRRTSEFQEPGTDTKRNSRSTQPRPSRVARPTSMDRQTLGIPTSALRGGRTTPQKHTQVADVPSTVSKFNTRTSRPTTRPNSLERQTLAIPNSALRGSRTTPQKTPTNTTTASRALFSNEKQRNAHNDKKWVQEKAQQIVEHLRDTAKPGAVHGLPYDFFARSGCLRQMSTKQFVGIINHFLYYIWGTRFTVSTTNYIDDIINILQKLQYPYQVNKSWLKTPTTSHSFGNAIQLFDFLMDFVRPQNEEEAAEMQFEFQDPQELIGSTVMRDTPDADFVALMVDSCEEGFQLWDKELYDDYNKLQQQKCDIYLQERCGVDGIAALDEELQKLKENLTEAQKKRPHINKQDEDLCLRLENEYKEMEAQVQQARQTLEIQQKKLDAMQAERQQCKNEFLQLVENLAEMRNIISKQKMSVEQRDSYIEELEKRKYTFQLMERTLRDLEGRQHHQQVLLSRHKKQLTDQIFKYNDYIRGGIRFTKLQCDTENLLLSLNPQEDEIKQLIKMLQEIFAHAQIQLQQTQEQQEKLEKQAQELNHYISSTLKLKCTELEMALNLAERKRSEFEKLKQEQTATIDQQMHDVEVRLQQLEFDCKNAQDEKREKQMQLTELDKQNEERMIRAEQEYKAAADEREAFLKDYEKALERSNEVLSEFSKLVDERDLELKRFEEEVEKL